MAKKDNGGNKYEEWDEATLAFWAQGLGLDARVHLREMGDEQLEAFRQDQNDLLTYIVEMQQERRAIENVNDNVIRGRFGEE